MTPGDLLQQLTRVKFPLDQNFTYCRIRHFNASGALELGEPFEAYGYPAVITEVKRDAEGLILRRTTHAWVPNSMLGPEVEAGRVEVVTQPIIKS